VEQSQHHDERYFDLHGTDLTKQFDGAQVLRPRVHLIPFDGLRAGRFHGLLAPNAKLRCEISPSPADHATEHSTRHAHAQGALVQRVDLFQTA